MSATKKAGFQWDDPFLFEAQLTEDERMIRDTAREFAQDKLLPRVLSAYAREESDPAIFAEMGSLGLLGVTLPETYGCAGANYVSYGLIARVFMPAGSDPASGSVKPKQPIHSPLASFGR